MMEDADSMLPPSKKRAAGRELSRDNPGLDDDDEEFPGQETATFKRASDEVLANRRIVKVRRSQPSTAPSSNPFASIRLVPSTNSNNNNSVQEIGKTESEEEESKKPEKADENDCGDEAGAAQNADEEKEEGSSDVRNMEPTNTDTEKGEDSEAKEGSRNDENIDGNSEKDTTATSVGLVGTGFSTSSFSFGSISKTDQPTFPSLSFGTNGNSSIFNNPNPEGFKISSVHVETGEENEKVAFTADSVLFEFLNGGWKERGKGELKVNVLSLTTGTKKARLVMRSKGNFRLILNASIFPDLKLTNMDKKGITFACLNSTIEGKEGLSTFALKFKDASIVEEFRSVVMEHKGEAMSAKTPESSPKASDE